MMTSFCSNRCRAACALWALILGTAACSDDNDETKSCADELATVELEPADDILYLATMRLENRRERSRGGADETTAIVTLSLSDRSLFLPQPRSPAPWSRSCFLFSGRFTSTCRDPAGASCGGETCSSGQSCVEGACVACEARPLSIEGARVQGLARADVALDRVGTDGSRWRDAAAKVPLFAGDAIDLQVQGGAATGEFPSYTQTVDAPEPVELTQPAPGTSVGGAAADLRVEWERGNGDWVEVALAPEVATGGTQDLVVCVVDDDGCATVPSIAIATLSSNAPNAPLTLSVSRVKSAVTAVEAPKKAAAQMLAIDRVDLPLQP